MYMYKLLFCFFQRYFFTRIWAIQVTTAISCGIAQCGVCVCVCVCVCRWVCTSGLPSDLNVTDNIALETMEELSKTGEKILFD